MPPEPPSAPPPSAGARYTRTNGHSAQKGVFRKEGEFWTLGYGGKSFRLKDAKGLGYIAHLLRHRGVEFHVLDLAGGIAGRSDDDETGGSASGLPRATEDLEKEGIHIGSVGDAGEMLDAQAKLEYRRRLSELREELEEARAPGNTKRAEQVEQEIDALTRELSRAVGLGGRDRRAASASERARQSISKSIKTIVERIARNDATLADILSRSIKTGTFCSYQPDPDFPIAWEFGTTDAGSIVERAERPAPSDVSAPPRAEPSGPSSPVTPAVMEVSPFSLADRTAFVGRDTEGGAIRTVIDRARAGRGSIVMLWDGPGVGKTRLAMEMAEYASNVGFRCGVGHCYERDERYPYLPFAEIIESNLVRAASLEDYRGQIGPYAAEMAQIAPSLRRVFLDLPKPPELPAVQQRGYLFQGFSEALARAARTRPQLLILEDLHWADESTLALLIYLAIRIAQLPVVIIGTYRSGYSDDNPVLVRTLEELIRMGVRPQKLGGLSKDAVAQMLRELSKQQAPEGFLSLIFEESQGYPFFVEEVYRHLLEEGKIFDDSGQFHTDIELAEIDVPDTVRLIINRRLERLDENEKSALCAAAVIGRSFSFQLLTAVSQIDIDELFNVFEKAQQMGIIVPSSEGPESPFTFRHELVRQTLLAGISAPRQEQMHASVADAIERLNPDAVNERAGEIADHLLKAGSFADRQKLGHWLTLAGQRALEAAAFEEARRSFRSALSYQGAVELRERAELLVSLAMAERGLDQSDALLGNLREALEIYANLGDREMVGKTFIELTDALTWFGRFRQATETAQRGLDYFQSDVSADHARLLAALAQAQAFAGGYEPAHAASQRALNIASKLSDSKLEGGLYGARSIVNFHFFRLKEAATDGLLCEQLGGTETSPWQHATQLRILHQTLLYLGRLEEAAKIADKLEPLASNIGQAYSVAHCLTTRAWMEFGKAPDLSKLENDYLQFSESSQKFQYTFWKAVSDVQLSQVKFFLGNWTDALSHAQASSRLRGAASFEGMGDGTLFRQMAYAGDGDGAFAILDQKRTRLPVRGQPNTRGSWLMFALVIEGLAMLGEQSEAEDLYPLVNELADTGAVVLWPISRFTQTIAAIAAAAAHRWEDAEQHFQIAIQQADSFPHRLEQADIRRFQAMMLLDRSARGDREKAQTLLNEALETYTQIGMPRHIEITRTLLDRAARR